MSDKIINAEEAPGLLLRTAEWPWDGGTDPRDPDIRSANGTLIAFVNEHKNDRVREELGEDYSMADARLIASAPDLARTVIAQAEEIGRLTRERDEAMAECERLRGSITPRQAVAVLVPRGDCFAAIRSNKHGGRIELPGGKVEPGEPPHSAARRESAEELGVQLSDTALTPLGEFLHVHNGQVWCCAAFAGELTGELGAGDAGETTWATRADLLAGPYGAVVRRILLAYDARLALAEIEHLRAEVSRQVVRETEGLIWMHHSDDCIENMRASRKCTCTCGLDKWLEG